MTPLKIQLIRCAPKKKAHDYRYFPEPDLIPAQALLSQAIIDSYRQLSTGTAITKKNSFYGPIRLNNSRSHGH